jgi:esterase
MMLYFRQMGAGEPVMILHGLYGSSDNWYSIGKELSEDYTVYLPDLRNHGQSPHSKEHNYKLMADDILDLLQTQQITSINIIGHSMGGKLGMYFALQYPSYVKSLTVVDISPGSYKSLTDYSEHSLFHLNMIQQMENLEPEKFTTRNEIDEEMAKVIPNHSLRQFILKNVQRGSDGKFSWKLNIKALKNALPSILEGIDPGKVNNGLGTNAYPVLFIKGNESGYIRLEDLDLIKKIYPSAIMKTIQQAGHWVHVQQPHEFLKIVRQFLKYYC